MASQPQIESRVTHTAEIIGPDELAQRWSLPASWIREQTRSRAADPLPCVRFGKYVRFRWQSPELEAWFARRCRNSHAAK